MGQSIGSAAGNSSLSQTPPRQYFFERLRHEPLHKVRATGTLAAFSLKTVIDERLAAPKYYPFNLRKPGSPAPSIAIPNSSYEAAVADELLKKFDLLAQKGRDINRIRRGSMLGSVPPESEAVASDVRSLIGEKVKLRQEIRGLESDLVSARRFDAVEKSVQPWLKEFGFKLPPAKFLNRVSNIALATGTLLSLYDIGKASWDDGHENGRTFGFGRRTWGALGANAGLWGGTFVGGMMGAFAGWPGMLVGSAAVGSACYTAFGEFLERVYDDTHKPANSALVYNQWHNRVIKLDVSSRPPPLSEISS